MESVHDQTILGRILCWSEERAASDLHGQTGRPYHVRIHGSLSPVPSEIFPAPDAAGLIAAFRECFSAQTCERIEKDYEVDLSFYHGTQRYRANFSSRRGLNPSPFASFRNKR
jgi:Tfp pilus assembly pilus retraction ATPase PilT